MIDTLAEIAGRLSHVGVTVVLAIIVVAIHLIFDIFLKYTNANIRYYEFTQGDGWSTYYIRNLDSVTYKEPLYIDIRSDSLAEVVVHAGPYAKNPDLKPDKVDKEKQSKKAKKATTIERVPGEQTAIKTPVVRVHFTKVPGDAAFVIRVHTVAAKPGDATAVELTIPEDEGLQARSFKALDPFKGALKFRYYAFRYVIGLGCLAGIFFGSLLWRNDHLHWMADYGILLGGAILATASFFLVVPHEGKTIVTGYLGWAGTGRVWKPKPAARLSVPPTGPGLPPADPTPIVPVVDLGKTDPTK